MLPILHFSQNVNACISSSNQEDDICHYIWVVCWICFRKKCSITLILYMSTSVDPTSWCTYPKTSPIKMNPCTSRNRPIFLSENDHCVTFFLMSDVTCTFLRQVATWIVYLFALTICWPFRLHHQITTTLFINLTKIISSICITSPKH